MNDKFPYSDVFAFNALENQAVRDLARRSWDSGHYVMVDARPVTRVDRTAVEARLISNGVLYHEVIYG